MTTASERPTIQIHPNPTQRAFIECQAKEAAMLGPRREGKSDGALLALTHHALQQPAHLRPIPAVVVRDTWKNLRRTTLANLLEPAPESFGAAIRPYLVISDGGRVIEFPGHWRLQCFGIDSLGDISNFQGMNLAVVWFDEVAAAAINDIGHGLLERAWTVAQSSLSYPCQTRAMITSNYPDEDHWLVKRFSVGHPDRALFRIPRGSNPHVTDEYRRTMAEALKDDPNLYKRLVEGEFGTIYEGVAVTPTYSDEMHVAPGILTPDSTLPALRFWDFGLTPACLVAQVTALGQLRILDGWEVKNTGIRQFIGGVVAPLMASPRYAAIKTWRDIGDPAGYTREQSDATISAAQVLNDMLKTSMEPAPKEWSQRRMSLERLLEKMVGKAEPMLLISPQIHALRKGLRGAWHYVEHHNDTISDLPLKSATSHICDALAYGAAVLLPTADTLVPDRPVPEPRMEPWMFREDEAASRTRSWMGVA